MSVLAKPNECVCAKRGMLTQCNNNNYYYATKVALFTISVMYNG